jgi:DNA (cytosine-5)-methyltransferase 1
VTLSKPRKGEYGVKLVRGPFVRLDPHPGHCETEDELFAVAGASERPLAADLFCGAGGMSLGLESAGFDVVLGVDHDADAVETHRATFPGMSVDWDLAEDDTIERVAGLIKRAGVTLVAGGPPCQPFSRAGRSYVRELVRTGRRPGHDHRRDFWQSFLAVVELSQPDAVLMENVPDMALDRDMMILRTMVDELELLGYSVESRVIETWRYGVPQFRNRLILVALKKGRRFEWPAESGHRVTVENAIGDLPPVQGGARPGGGAEGWWEYESPRTAFQKRAREGVERDDFHKIFDHITRPVREDDLKAFSQMDTNTRYSALAPELKRYRDDIFDDKYKRLDANDVSRTITAHIAKDGYWYIHPWQDRTLTVREAARLQTFPDHVRFAGPPSAAFRQIGNAVPPLLAEHIGTGILQSLAVNQRNRISARGTAEKLGVWFTERRELHVPWLRAETRWQVLMAELLLDRVASPSARLVWPALAGIRSPSDALKQADAIRTFARQLRRPRRGEQIVEAARWFAKHPKAFDSIDSMMKAPHLNFAMAELAARVIVDETQDPVIVTNGVLRVVARFTGRDVDRRNRLSDGRMGVAGMIAADPLSDTGYLGLIELSHSHCRPQDPVCAGCPLDSWCVESRTRRSRGTQLV